MPFTSSRWKFRLIGRRAHAFVDRGKEANVHLGGTIPVRAAIVVTSGMACATEQPSPPLANGPLANTSTSHALLASEHLKQAIDLRRYGYVEDEFYETNKSSSCPFLRTGSSIQLRKQAWSPALTESTCELGKEQRWLGNTKCWRSSWC